MGGGGGGEEEKKGSRAKFSCFVLDMSKHCHLLQSLSGVSGPSRTFQGV